jgi:hypothetical protein
MSYLNHRPRYNRPWRAQRRSRGIALLILDLSTRRGWVISTMPQPLYPRERPGTHCTGGWVGRRAGLDVCKKSCPHRDFFFLVDLVTFCSFLTLVVRYCSSMLIACCGFSHYEKSDGFGRERTRNLGFQRPACKPLDHRSRWIRSPDRPACSQSLYRLSYLAHI